MVSNLDELAARYGVSIAAIHVLRDAVRRRGGRQAQFSHPDLGGMGQWSTGGMTQVGDMFNTALKDKVSALCTELSRDSGNPVGKVSTFPEAAGTWWPEGLGRPSSTGSQNGMHYACFPETRRIAIRQAETVTL